MKLKEKSAESEPFYKKGLRFTCVKDCSKCCSGAPGYVWLEGEDVVNISRFLKIPVLDFLAKYTKDLDGRLSLIDIEEEDWSCVMLENGRCSIYEHRPIQCRTYPFWDSSIYSKETWERVTTECPGAGEGRLYSEEEIDSIANEEESIDSII